MSKVKLFVLVILILNLSWAIFDVKTNKVGQWEVCISNYGKFGQTRNTDPGAWWPRGSGRNYIYGAGIWIGAIAPNGDTLVTVGYEPKTAKAEFTPGPPYSNYNDPQWRVYLSTEPGYPFNPISVEDGYAIYNDFDSLYHVPNDMRPIGITVVLKTFVFPRDWAEDMLFLKYIIKNDTNYTINNLYAGFCMDYDIGNESGAMANDRGGIDLQRRLFYGWQEKSEPGWTERPGMIGLKQLSPFPLSCFKRFTLDVEPTRDPQRYMTMAGYNFQNGNYEPFDTIWFPPDDQRILISTGPLSLIPGDSIILDYVLIASEDSIPPSSDMEYKADKAQGFFDTGFHTVHINQPNGGEIISGNYQILYTANPVPPNPLLVDLFLLSEHGYDTIALNQPNIGSYNWNTIPFSDGVLNRIIAVAYDTVALGGDISDGHFTINNPGNSPPYLKIISPAEDVGDTIDTLVRDCHITWFARDPEFQDSLWINIYFTSEYDTSYQPIGLNEPNDSHFIWNTLSLRNGAGLLILETCDEEFIVADTVRVYLLNQISGGPLVTIAGRNNCVDLAVLVHQPEYLTGHTYELEFLEYKRIADTGFLNYPEYTYKITDLNTGMVVLDTYSLKNAYYWPPYTYRVGFNDFSPIVDGFSIRAFTQTTGIISPTNFRNDSVKVTIGTYPEDHIIILDGVFAFAWWPYRGARLQIDWTLKTGGGLTLLITDLDYGDTIPYKPYGGAPGNPDSAFGWCFRRFPPGSGTPSDTLRSDDRFIYLCGARIRFSRAVPVPEVGDRWIVYPSQYSPPIKGNIYRFTPTNYVAEVKSELGLISFNLYPVPTKKNLRITYTLAKMERIKLVIYDILGREVKCLKDGVEKAGVHSVLWNGLDEKKRKVSAGVYFCRFETDDYKATKKIILVR